VTPPDPESKWGLAPRARHTKQVPGPGLRSQDLVGQRPDRLARAAIFGLTAHQFSRKE